MPANGFFVRHGFTTENTWYNPGYWHTGEDWYLLDGESGGSSVLAIADGRVVYAGSNYPGRVVIIEHQLPDGGTLFSMYGHLDFALQVVEGADVSRGQVIGTVLTRDDGVPSHLHFEIRDFLFRDEVNGDSPRYGFRCGPRCAPGPGYWPIDAPELPIALGWQLPAHRIAARPARLPGTVVVSSQPLNSSLPLWSAPPDAAPQPVGAEAPLTPGATYELLGVWTGAGGTSATAYEVWYLLRLPTGVEGWVRATSQWDFETGSDGQPSSVRLDLLPTE